MKRLNLNLILCLLAFSASAQRDYTSLVNPFIGTGGHGHTYPGASMPFGMMQLSPDTRMADWDGSSGYHYSDSVIYGFSHTHLSGTGIPDYCDVLFMPYTGEVKWDNKDYRSTYSHKNEKASPGYYEVLLDNNKIKVQLATSYRSGMHQYGFPKSAKEGAILIDLKHRDEVLESWIEKVSDHELRGLRRSRSWAQDQYLYFYVRFERPIKKFEVLNDAGNVVNDTRTSGKNLKISVSFDLPANKMLKAQVGISGVDADGAKMNLESEIHGWNLETLTNASKKAWNAALAKIDVLGGSIDQQKVFYTALYHTMLPPNIYQDVSGKYRGTDLKIHSDHPNSNYSVFSLWDTYRAFNPLMTIINENKVKDWIATFRRQYEQGGMLPVWELSGNETFCMIGYHSVPVIVDATQKGIVKPDAELLQAMVSYAESNRFGLPTYRELGYVSNDRENESASKTLEYAYDDWCIAQYARMLGNDSVYSKYIRRAQNYKNLFDPQTHNMRGKIQAMWQSPFDPREINNFYTEGNSWQYSFAAPQDIETLIQLHGGKESFAAKLNELFTTSSKTTGRDQSDVTGLIGQYAQGNEPSHHMAYLFNYVGMPWRTQELIHKICTEFYRNDPDGLIGNEDCGQMSAWYVLSSMGIYPVCPGSGEYVLGTPSFDQVTIHMENGKQFVIKAKRTSKDSEYIATTKLNGKSSTRNYLLHTDIKAGGILEFQLADQPNKQWGSRPLDLPHSRITENQIVPVPFFNVRSNKFKDSLEITISDIEASTAIEFEVFPGAAANGMHMEKSGRYFSSFTIDTSSVITARAVRGDQGDHGINDKRSVIVSQRFFKVPSDKSIKVLSEVNPMYNGGGSDALIDGIVGNSNWRTGDWQGYYNKDFEAIIDLQQQKQVNYLAVHVLQDPGPWILYPKELIVYTSEDGRNFTEVKRIENTIDQKMETIQVQELGGPMQFKTRYIKVKAVNAGKLPSWHESAGNPSHLFIDEVIVR